MVGGGGGGGGGDNDGDTIGNKGITMPSSLCVLHLNSLLNFFPPANVPGPNVTKTYRTNACAPYNIRNTVACCSLPERQPCLKRGITTPISLTKVLVEAPLTRLADDVAHAVQLVRLAALRQRPLGDAIGPCEQIRCRGSGM